MCFTCGWCFPRNQTHDLEVSSWRMLAVGLSCACVRLCYTEPLMAFYSSIGLAGFRVTLTTAQTHDCFFSFCSAVSRPLMILSPLSTWTTGALWWCLLSAWPVSVAVTPEKTRRSLRSWSPFKTLRLFVRGHADPCERRQHRATEMQLKKLFRFILAENRLHSNALTCYICCCCGLEVRQKHYEYKLLAFVGFKGVIKFEVEKYNFNVLRRSKFFV